MASRGAYVLFHSVSRVMSATLIRAEKFLVFGVHFSKLAFATSSPRPMVLDKASMEEKRHRILFAVRHSRIIPY